MFHYDVCVCVFLHLFIVSNQNFTFLLAIIVRFNFSIKKEERKKHRRKIIRVLNRNIKKIHTIFVSHQYSIFFSILLPTLPQTALFHYPFNWFSHTVILCIWYHRIYYCSAQYLTVGNVQKLITPEPNKKIRVDGTSYRWEDREWVSVSVVSHFLRYFNESFSYCRYS